MQAPYQIGDWVIYPARNRMARDGEEIAVEPRIIDLLNCFANHPGEVLNRDTLIAEAWAGIIVSETTINHTVGVLRRALGDKARDPRYIETVAKKGYRLLLAPVVLDAKVAGHNTLQAVERAAATKRPAYTYWAGAAIVTVVATLLWRAAMPAVPMIETAFTSLRPITSDAGQEFSPASGPGGEYVYYSHTSPGGTVAEIYRKPLGGGSAVRLLAPSSGADQYSGAVSRDGKRFAYARYTGDQCSLTISDVDGSNSYSPLEGCGAYGAQLSWSPSGDLFFVNSSRPRGPQKIFRLSPADGEVTEVTPGGTGVGDYSYALSGDGRKLAYMNTTHWNHSDLHVLDLGSGEDKLIYQFTVWTSDFTFDEKGENLYFIADAYRHTLERLNIETGMRTIVMRGTQSLREPEMLPGDEGILATQTNWDMNIFSVDLTGKTPTSTLIGDGTKLVFSTRADVQPRLSPDGQTLAFLSDRTGQMEIWVSDTEGHNARQISRLDGTLSVHVFDWGVDSKTLFYDAGDDRIYSLDLMTGDSKALTPEGLRARNPEASPDGKSIVFTSAESGTWQIYQQDLSGGAPRQITQGGAFSAAFGPDGTLYFTKYYRDGLWQLDSETDAEVLRISNMTTGPFRQWELTAEGVYFINPQKHPARLMYQRWDASAATELYAIPFQDFTFEVSADGKTLLFSREENHTSDIVLLE